VAARIIFASHHASLSQALSLDGQRISGELHLFVTEPGPGLRFVDFCLEDSAGEQWLVCRGDTAPFTTMPVGESLRLDDLGEGMYAIVGELHDLCGAPRIPVVECDTSTTEVYGAD